MKTIRISDQAHGELTRVLGEMMAKTGKIQTYNDVINALISRSKLVPDNVIEKIKAVIAKKQVSYTTPKDFIEDAVNAKLQSFGLT